MKTRIITTFLTAVFLVAIATPVISQNTEQLFQKGIMKEEGEGNLPEAIEIFNSIVEDSEADDALQAKALLHVGLCYEKLGKNEASRAYQKLINNFPSQKNEVALAKERLSKLLVAEKESITPLIPKFTKIQTPFHIPQWSGSCLSPDGKTMAFGSGNNVWTVPVPGKVDPGLAGEPTKLEGASNVLGEGLIWSGNGRFIAFSRVYARDLRGGATRIKFNPDGAYIDVVPSTGGEPKRIHIPRWVANNGNTYRQLSLSPDAKMVAFDSDKQIYIAIVETGEIRQVTQKGGISPSFSPDGKKVAFLTPPVRKNNPPRRISEVMVISLDGGNLIKVSGDLNENLSSKSPAWSPSGHMLAFGRINRKGKDVSSEVCIVRLSEQGKPLASPIQIELPLFSRDFIAGWPTENKIGLLMETPYHEYIYTVSVSGGKATQISPLDDLAGIPNWSPNGERIFYRTNGIISSVPSGGGAVSAVPAFKESDITIIYPGGGNSISPDGKHIAVATYVDQDDANLNGIYTIPVNGELPKQIIDNGRYPRWSPDGNWIAYLAREDVNTEKSIVTIYKIHKEGGEPQKITSEFDYVTEGGFDWSPDGKTIAYFSKKKDTSAGTLNLISIDGGESREVCQIKNIIAHNNISWSPDGQKIAFTSNGKIWVVSAHGGEPVELKVDVDAYAGMLDWSPDGKKIVFSGGSGMKKELWFMEDFLPLEKLAQNNTPEKEPEGIKIRQIWQAPYLDDFGTVSLDGKYRSYVDWGVGNVGIHNLMTDEKKVLTMDAKLGEDWQFAESTVISRDGKKIVYSWANPYNTNALRLINVETPEPELLYKKTGEELYPTAWLSDKEILVYRSVPDTRRMQLVTFNVADKKIKVKKTFLPGQFEWGLACSPDEKYIAYCFANSADKGNTDIKLLEANGGRDIPLITHPSNDKLLGWVPGSKEFLFISNRSGSWDLWAIKLDEAKPLGPAKRIYADIGEVSPMGFTRDGECYIGFSRRNFYSGLALFNKEKGTVDLETGQSMESQKFFITWSPDCQHLAYIKIEDNSKGNPFKLFVQDVKSGQEFQPDNNTLRVHSYKWSPDGKSILVIGREIDKLQDKEYKGGIFVVDIETGQTDQVLLLSEYEFNRPEDDSAPLSCVEWSQDERSFYYLFQKDRLVKHNLETGEDKKIYKFPDFSPYILETSPDDKNLLFGLEYPDDEKSCLYTMPAEGGKEKMVCTSQEANRIIWAQYSPDGREIYFVELPEFNKSVLWRVPVEGGKPEKIWSAGKRVEIYDIHPDGDQVAFSIRERTTEVRVIEGLVNELNKIYSYNE
jgi:Tol biopolymer transport system component